MSTPKKKPKVISVTIIHPDGPTDPQVLSERFIAWMQQDALRKLRERAI